MSLFIQLGFFVIYLLALVLFYRLIKFILIVFFGTNLTVTYVDKKGVKYSKKVQINKNDPINQLLAEIKIGKKTKQGELH